MERKRKRARADTAEREADRLAEESDDGADSDGDLPSHQVKATPEGKPRHGSGYALRR